VVTERDNPISRGAGGVPQVAVFSFLAPWPKCHAGVTVGREPTIKYVTIDVAKA
jgi:hypothetical protein